jgi:hypothetical protein
METHNSSADKFVIDMMLSRCVNQADRRRRHKFSHLHRSRRWGYSPFAAGQNNAACLSSKCFPAQLTHFKQLDSPVQKSTKPRTQRNQCIHRHIYLFTPSPFAFLPHQHLHSPLSLSPSSTRLNHIPRHIPSDRTNQTRLPHRKPNPFLPPFPVPYHCSKF